MPLTFAANYSPLVTKVPPLKRDPDKVQRKLRHPCRGVKVQIKVGRFSFPWPTLV